ncbi:MAG TPA: acyltransferase [Mucilaginibacter sp.]|jgi:acetyltransferase-like isoleucine patch superfamily enzyme
MILKIFTLLLPWPLRRLALQSWFGYKIHPKAKIGLSWVFPKKLIMDEGAKIEMLTVAIHLDKIEMNYKSKIGRGNWITGFPTNTNSLHFKNQVGRRSELIVGENSAITKNHHIDCTNLIQIGRFSTIAGYQTQLLTHSIDILKNCQDSAPILIGDYTFVGTNATILGGAILPDYSVLGAKSLLNKSYSQQWTLYGGVPAKPLQELPKDAKYFHRLDGYIY